MALLREKGPFVVLCAVLATLFLLFFRGWQSEEAMELVVGGQDIGEETQLQEEVFRNCEASGPLSTSFVWSDSIELGAKVELGESAGVSLEVVEAAVTKGYELGVRRSSSEQRSLEFAIPAGFQGDMRVFGAPATEYGAVFLGTEKIADYSVPIGFVNIRNERSEGSCLPNCQEDPASSLCGEPPPSCPWVEGLLLSDEDCEEPRCVWNSLVVESDETCLEPPCPWNESIAVSSDACEEPTCPFDLGVAISSPLCQAPESSSVEEPCIWDEGLHEEDAGCVEPPCVWNAAIGVTNEVCVEPRCPWQESLPLGDPHCVEPACETSVVRAIENAGTWNGLEELNGEPLTNALDGSVATGFQSTFQDWQLIEVDLGCLQTVSGFRRHMTKDGAETRNLQGEGFSYSRDGETWERVLTARSSGWDTYGPYAERAWGQVPYGWSAWLLLDDAVEVRFIRFDWDGDFDRVDEIEVQLD